MMDAVTKLCIKQEQDQPLCEIVTNAAPQSVTKLPIPHSKLKAPTPSGSFKRPATVEHAHDQGNAKRFRPDVLSSSTALVNDAPKVNNKTNNLISKSKSMATIRPSKPRVTRPVVPVQHTAGFSSNILANKTSSMSNLTTLKTSASSGVSAPITKTGKRPAWDLKGRMQDNEDALNAIRIQNSDLVKTTELYNQRLAMLESANCQLSEEVKTKETLSTEKAHMVDELKGQLNDKIKACTQYETTISVLQRELSIAKSDLSSAQQVNNSLENTIATMTSSQVGLKAQLTSTLLEFDKCLLHNKELGKTISSLKSEINGLQTSLLISEKKLRDDECLRRKLHNTIQELKGNIRVFCRVRPVLSSDTSNPTMIVYSDDADHRSMEIIKNLGADDALKTRGGAKHTFSFDRIFEPTADQTTVFDEVSQLVQSALDGYNVCIFAYGQTGSGKTFTMEGPVDVNSDQRGMIPRTVEKIFESVKNLEVQGWQYRMEATFVEIYNETIRDLLGNPLETKLKHEIKMCDAKTNDIYISNVNTVIIESEKQVYQLLSQAQKNRAVAATMCNKRSSRSHSVFRLCLAGNNDQMSQTCQGMLNLVDLAGSERLKESQSEGERLRETKSINKSLSTLANVITCLANKNEHIPYRNSKLTHMLMNSLGGNSKTLMVVNVSPCEDTVNETLNSLRFAATVNQCVIGTAQKKRVRTVDDK